MKHSQSYAHFLQKTLNFRWSEGGSGIWRTGRHPPQKSTTAFPLSWAYLNRWHCCFASSFKFLTIILSRQHDQFLSSLRLDPSLPAAGKTEGPEQKYSHVYPRVSQQADQLVRCLIIKIHILRTVHHIFILAPVGRISPCHLEWSFVLLSWPLWFIM